MSDMRLAIEFMKVLQKKYPEIMKRNVQEGDPNFSFYPYVNGRERGFAVIKEEYKDKQYENFRVIIFAEHRNSDTLRLFYGLNTEFDDDEWNEQEGKDGKKYLDILILNRHFIPSEKVFRTQEKNYHLDSMNDIEQAVNFVRKYFK